MPRKAARRKRISAEGIALKTVRFKFWITGDSGILGSGVAENCSQKPDAYPLMPTFAASVFFATTVNSDGYGGSVWEPNPGAIVAFQWNELTGIKGAWFTRQPAHLTQGERNARFRVERWMTAGKNQGQPIILRFEISRELVLRRIKSCPSTQSINGLESASRNQPWSRPVRNTSLRPGLQSGGECLVHGLFGEIPISEEAHERRQNPSGFRSVKSLNGPAEFVRAQAPASRPNQQTEQLDRTALGLPLSTIQWPATAPIEGLKDRGRSGQRQSVISLQLVGMPDVARRLRCEPNQFQTKGQH
jgi:hypothetical protein